MARVSQLPAASAASGADLVMIVQGGDNKKLTISNLFSKINAPVHINQASGDVDTMISGSSDINLIFVDASENKVGIGTNTPIDKLDVYGGINFSGIFSNESSNTQTVSGAVTLLTDTTIVDSVSDISITLGIPSRSGQVKTIVNKSTGLISLSGVGFAGFTTVTFNSVGDSVVLKYIDGSWYMLSGYGVSVS